MDSASGANVHQEPLRVRHSGLERLSSESAYKSKCPSCKHGALLMRRDRRTFRLLREDDCVACGQRFVYVDAAVNGEALPPEPLLS